MIAARESVEQGKAKCEFNEWASLFSGRLFVKIIAYADESGTHDKTGKLAGATEAVVGGLVASPEDWANFCIEWQATLDKFKAPYFHYKEWRAAFELKKHQRPPFREFIKNPYREWSIIQLNDFLLELAKIAGSGDKPHFGAYVNTTKFHKAILTGDVLIGGDPYRWCVGKCFSEFANEVEVRWPNFSGPVSFFFDWTSDPKWRSAILDTFALYKERDARFSEIAFANKKEKPHLPLQAADMIAYRTRQITGKYLKQEAPLELPPIDNLLFAGTFKCFEAHAEEIFTKFVTGQLAP